MLDMQKLKNKLKKYVSKKNLFPILMKFEIQKTF